MLKVDSVWKSYDKIPVLKDISFKVSKGEVLGLLGPNGAGKTTLLKILAAYHMPDSGSVSIDNYSIIEDSITVKSLCGYLSENSPLFEYMTIKEYLSFLLSSMGTDKPEISTEIDKLLELFSLQNYRNAVISKLSSGFKQRCAIAGALAGNISLLILDEPGKGLDPRQIVELRDIIKSYSKELTIIISSHILNEIELLCDRVLILDNGELKYDTHRSEREKKLESITYEVVVSGEDKIVRTLNEDQRFSLKSIIQQKQNKYKLMISISREDFLRDEGALIYDSIVEKSLRLHSLVEEKNTLEEIFMKITGNTHE